MSLDRKKVLEDDIPIDRLRNNLGNPNIASEVDGPALRKHLRVLNSFRFCKTRQYN